MRTQCLVEPRSLDGGALESTTSASVRLELITKRFGGILANDSVSCDINTGGIHTFLGENGAGKSTLMKILCGHYQPDSGLIWVDQQRVVFQSPSQARNLGIGMVHQQFTLVPSMTVLENVLLGDASGSAFLRLKIEAEKVEAKACEFGLSVDVLAPVWRLSIAERQKVEILKLLWRNARILILDEPTSQLAPFEAEEILLTMEKLSKQGRIVVLISHHIEEILRFSSHISVLRKGRCVANLASHTVEARELAQLMVDKLEIPSITRSEVPVQSPCLKVTGVNLRSTQTNRSLNSVNLEIYTGEVLGIAGVIGSGQDEVAAIITGHLLPSAGSLVLAGKAAPWSALKHAHSSAAYVPSDSKLSSVASLTAAENSMLRDINRKDFLRGPFLRSRRIRQTAEARISAFDVRPNDANALCGSLSGGNLQRLILSRELANPSKILVTVNPTAGLDLAMSLRIRQELRNAAASGKAVILVSPDLQELLSTCDRIMVMCSGSVIGTERVEDLDAESLGLLLGGAKIDIVRKLSKFLQCTDGAQLDEESRSVLSQLLQSKSTWQKRLAAQIALRVFVQEDLSEIETLLAGEKNDECRAWLSILRAKLGTPSELVMLESVFAESPGIFIEVERRILKCDDLKSLKDTLASGKPVASSVWESLLAKLVLDYLEHDAKGRAPSSEFTEIAASSDLQTTALR
jgi:general nucleoside transport system ATP-binding protein